MGFENYKDCKVCGKLFMQMTKRTICPECLKNEEEYFKIVRDYLYKYPSASVQEVSEQTDVHEEFILDWLKSGRLEKKGMTSNYPCEMCGRPIHVGRICQKCQEELGGLTSSLSSDKKEKSSEPEKKINKMYISEKKKY